MKNRGLLCCFIALTLLGGGAATAKPAYPVQKTDAEWKKQLSPEAYEVLRKAGTEAPYSGEYVKEKRKGSYSCAGCGEVLFGSVTKFDSHCGWPSFYKPASSKAVQEKSDKSHGMERTEILCSGCGGHLGHVFNDGPPPTNLRYCINSDALVFKPEVAAKSK